MFKKTETEKINFRFNLLNTFIYIMRNNFISTAF